MQVATSLDTVHEVLSAPLGSGANDRQASSNAVTPARNPCFGNVKSPNPSRRRDGTKLLPDCERDSVQLRSKFFGYVGSFMPRSTPRPGTNSEAEWRYENASSQVPRVEAFEYSVARFSKKLVCSMAFSIWSIHGSGFLASLR